MKIDRKRMVITGASSGIGRALLQELSSQKVHVFAVARDASKLEEAVGSVIGSRATVTPFACDLGLQSDVDALFEHALQQMGGVDTFFANAGFAYWERVREPDWDHIAAIFETNVFSPIYAVDKMHSLRWYQAVDARVSRRRSAAQKEQRRQSESSHAP